jgi:hypothetical protein
VFVDRFNDDFVNVSPCCQAVKKREPVSTFDFVKSPYLTELREKFNRGQKPIECDWCWKLEQHGHKSRRVSAIEFFNTPAPDREIQLQSIDYSATWACNLACIMCGSHSSSFWATQDNLSRDELKKIGRLFQKSNNILENLELGNIKKIHFNGGEPMLNHDQLDLLSKLEEQKVLQDVFISYNTNATVMPSEKIIKLWSKAKLVKIFFSIDAVGSAFEYIRWPAKWIDTEQNILTMKQQLPSNVMFGFNCTVGAYNLLELENMYEWFVNHIQHNRDGDPSDFCWQLANVFKIENLPMQVKHMAIERLKCIPEFSGLVGYLQSIINYHENSNWITNLDSLDKQRNTNWRQALEISKYIEEHTC